MKKRFLPRLGVRTLLIGGCAAVLIWVVVTRSFASYLADVAPAAALWLDPGQPDALVNLADRSLNASMPTFASSGVADDQTPNQQRTADLEKRASPVNDDNQSAPERNPGGKTSAAIGPADPQALADVFAIVDTNQSIDLATLRGQAVSALMRDPVNPAALRILGQISATTHDDANAKKFMEAAVRLSLHQGMAVYWLMRKSTKDGDATSAIAYADALLRTNPRLDRYTVPVLAHFAGEPASTGAVEAVLEKDPPWRRLFFTLLPQSVTDARTPLKLLVALKNSPTPPSAEDVKPYLDLLLAHKFYDLAYYTWLQFLPAEKLRVAGLLFNGGFELSPTGMPFDWSITQGSGVAVDIVPRPDATDQHALSVDFLYGRVDYQSVSELVVLPPGNYRFTGQYTGKIVGPRGMKWRIVCANDSHSRIGESQMIVGAASTWKTSDFAFTVPPTDCRAQYVRLDLDARMASEQIVSGTLLFDDLSISRVAAAPNAIAPAAFQPSVPQPTAAPNPGPTGK